MKAICTAIALTLLLPLVAFGQEQSPREFYYNFIQTRDELRSQFSISTEEGRNQFYQAFQPLRDSLKAFIAETSPEGLREDDLFYFATLAGWTEHEDKAIEAHRIYLEKFPRGLFVSVVRKELFKRLTMANRVEEAEELLPTIQAKDLDSFYECLSYQAWAYQRQEKLKGALAVYRRFFDETVRRAGHEPLPSYRIARSIPSMVALMEEMGKGKEALALLEDSLPKLEAAPQIQERIQISITSLKVLDAPAPEFNVERWVNGEGGSVDSLRGKVALVDFWATWCGPCIKAFPEIKEIQQELAGEDFIVLGLTKYYGRYRANRDLTKDEEAAKIAQDFVPEYGIGWPLGIADSDSLFGSYGVTGLPTVFLIDKRGIVRKRIVGHKEENKEKLLRAIRELLAEEF